MLGGIVLDVEGRPNQVKISVPNVTDKTVDVAVKEIRAQNLLPVTKNVPSDKPVNTVVDQNPKGGADVKKGAMVTLSVSAGKAVVDSPMKCRVTWTTRSANLKAAKFNVRSGCRGVQEHCMVKHGDDDHPALPGLGAGGHQLIHIIPSKGVKHPQCGPQPSQGSARPPTQAVLFAGPQQRGQNDVAAGNITRTNLAYGTQTSTPQK